MKIITITVLMLLTTATFADDNWPQFRGPSGDGTTKASNLPLQWSESENITWKTPLPNKSWSSPVIWGNQIWMTNASDDGKQLYAVCVDFKTGNIVHNTLVFTINDPDNIHSFNTYASPTPVIEKGRVYVHFGTYGTACLDTTTAQMIWSRTDLKCDHGVGPGSSLLIVDDKLICIFDGMDVQFLVALNKKNGKTIWKTKRDTDFGKLIGDMRKAFSTPTLIHVNGKQQLVSTGASYVYAYDPATGKQIWKVSYPKGFSAVSRPTMAAGMIWVNSGYNKPRLLAVKPTGTGDVTQTHVAYTLLKDVPIKSSPAVVDNQLYLISDNGVLSCVDAIKGKRVWRERIRGHFSASPIIAPDRLYFFDDDGLCTVIKPGDKFIRLAKNQLDAGCMASPAVKDNALIIRTKTHLYRIENQTKSPQ